MFLSREATFSLQKWWPYKGRLLQNVIMVISVKYNRFFFFVVSFLMFQMLKISHHSLLQINFIVIVPSQNLDVRMINVSKENGAVTMTTIVVTLVMKMLVIAKVNEGVIQIFFTTI